ncbi:MAG: GatB/YqeY domain-containing protein [Candidatus Magasanikbacteria bacterium]|nr:GatB/YqeY domain-containing protein [Candidatus Magasanikbacteria bacterium]
MALRDDIQSAQTSAMKARQTETLSTLRMLWSAIRNEEINLRQELTDEEVVGVVSRQIKQLRDSATDFAAGGRIDLAEKANAEIKLLETYLPVQMSDDELDSVTKKIINDLSATGVGDVGKVMGNVMKQVKGKADGNRVRNIVTRLLS